MRVREVLVRLLAVCQPVWEWEGGMRARAATRNDVLQLDLFGLRLPAPETLQTLQLPGRDLLARCPNEDGNAGSSSGPAVPAVSDGRTTRHDAPPFEPVAADSAPTEDLVVPPATVREPEPRRNESNYRITDSDKVGVGSPKQKCRHNVAAIELLKRLG